jgi:adenylate cyclase
VTDLPAPPNVNRDARSATAWLLDWLDAEAWKIGEPQPLLREICERLVAVGVPLEAFNGFIRVLHPDYFGIAHRWRRATGEVSTGAGRHAVFNTDIVQRSPLALLFKGAWAVRFRLEREVPPEFPVLADYVAEGATDYVAMRLPGVDDAPHSFTFTTNRPGGFTTAELALIDRLLSPIARLVELQAMRYLATVLLDTYVGHQTGAEILKGNIRRGSGRTLSAVILTADLEGFTELSARLPREALIEHLNAYFDALGKAVHAHGGEILKFIGDAMLAIFPVADAEAVQERCRAALAAAADALAGIDAHCAERSAKGLPEIRFGVALHIGDVMYGNIGTAKRLDFTVIGPAVNLAARIESLTRSLGAPLLLSAEFVAASGIAAVSRGRHQVKGIEAPVEVFAPAGAAIKTPSSNATAMGG